MHEVERYTGIEEVYMYICEVERNHCLDHWVKQHTCTHTHMQVFFSNVYPPDETWFTGKKHYLNEWYACYMCFDSNSWQMDMHHMNVTCTLRMLYVL